MIDLLGGPRHTAFGPALERVLAVVAALLVVSSMVVVPAAAGLGSAASDRPDAAPGAIDGPVSADHGSDAANGSLDGSATGPGTVGTGGDPVPTSTAADAAVAPAGDRGNTGFQPWYLYAQGVNTANGNLFRSTEDVSIQARGMNLTFVRSYNSHASAEHGPLGFGWTHNYAMRLEERSDGSVVFVDEDGSGHTFTPSNGGYEAPPGIHARLQANRSGFDLDRLDGRTLGFDADGTLQWIADRNDNRVHLEYADGRLTTVRDDSGQRLELTYTDEGRIRNVTDPLGRTVEYAYETGDLVAVTGVAGRTTEFDYYENHKLRAVVQPSSIARTYSYYDGSGRVRCTHAGVGDCGRDGLGFEYHDANDTVHVRSGLTDETTAVRLNDAGNPTGLAAPNTSVDLTWDAEMNLVELTNGSGSRTFTYDEYGNRLSETGPDGETTRFGWRTVATADRYVSLLTNRTTPEGLTTRYRYDAEGNRIAETNPVGQTRHMRYDAHGNRVSETDFAGHETTYTYDTHGFRTSVTDPTGRTTEFTYDAIGRRVSRTDPRNNTYRFAWDARGNLVERVDPLGNVTRYVYDDAGNLLEVVDATGRTIGAGNRPPSVSPNLETDGDGRTVAATGTDGEVTVRREFEGERVDSVTFDYGSFTKRVDYRFDDRGRVTAVDGPGGTTTYEYDTLGRVVRVVGPAGERVDYTYDAAGRRTAANYSNGVTTTYAYDDAGRLRNATAVNRNGSVLFGYEYTYDSAGNVVAVTDAGGNVTRYAYDALDRLTEVSYPSGKTVSYAYDAVGNRLSRTVNGTETTNYAYDASNELLEAGDTRYAYDEHGNRVEKRVDGNVTTYEYGSGARLTAAELPGGDRIEFSYLHSGERLSKEMPTGTTYYMYASSDVLAEFHANGTLKRRYTPTLAMDRPLAVAGRANRSLAFYHRDARNDVRALTDTNGSVVAAYDYSPFGRTRRASGGVPNPYRFAGRRYDERTGLYYNRMRYYDPATGQFTRPDPLGLTAGVNQYRYAEGNPLRFTDPTGLDWWVGYCGSGGPSSGRVTGEGIATGTTEGVLEDLRQFVSKSGTCSGVIQNSRSGQFCAIDVSITEVGLFASLTGPGVEGSFGPLPTLDGPECGAGLEGETFYCLAPKVEVVAGGGGEVGAGACASTSGFSTAFAELGLSAELGGELGGSIGRAITIENVECVCNSPYPEYQDCPSCEEEDDDDDDPPGNDHPDDTHDPSVLSFDRSVDRSSVPEYDRYDPAVAVLDRGFDAELEYFLDVVNESTYDTVEVDVSRERLDRYDVLVVPTGGLMGLASFPPFEEKLDRFVENGGTLLVLPQQRGYQYGPVPGELRGYGWVEDQSCQFRSVGIDEYCPIVASQSDDVADINVDGYFTDYPEDAEIILTRAKNGQPSMLKYGHGNGTVIATNAYTDWASGHHAWNEEGRDVLRDAVTWARGPRNLTTYAPGENVSVSLDTTSYVDLRADRVEVRLYRPEAEFRKDCATPSCNVNVDFDRVPPLTANTSGGLAALDDRAVSVDVPVPRGAQTGIWEVGYALYNESHGEVQAVRETEQVAVSTFEPSPGGYQRFDSNIKLSVTSDAEEYAEGSNATFTITARNEGSENETVTLWWAFPHHHREEPGDDASYGASTTEPANDDSALNRTLDVPAGGERTITHEVPVSEDDRLWLQAHRGTNRSGEYLGRTSRGFFAFHPSVDVDVSTDRGRYVAGANASVEVALGSRRIGIGNATVETVVLAPDNTLVERSIDTVRLGPNGTNLSRTVSLPTTPTTGHHVVTTEVLDSEGERIGYDSTTFEVPFAIRVTPSLPATVRENNTVSFAVENVGDTPVTNASLEASLADPAGTVAWTDRTRFDVAGDGTARPTFDDVTLPERPLGEYEFRYTLAYGTTRRTQVRTLENGMAGSGRFGAARYRQRENASATVTLRNTGRFAVDANVTVEVPDAGFTEARPLALDPGDGTTLNYTFGLPADISAGTHEAVLTVGSTNPVTRTFDFSVPESDLDIDVEQGGFGQGENVTLTLRNTGGVDTEADCSVEFTDPQGRTLPGPDLGGTARAGGTVTANLTVPEQAVSGTYFVELSCTDGTTGETTDLTETVDVTGLSADVAATTDAEVYESGENVTVTVNVSNRGGAVENGTLHVEVTDPSVREGESGSGESTSSLGAAAGDPANGSDSASRAGPTTAASTTSDDADGDDTRGTPPAAYTGEPQPPSERSAGTDDHDPDGRDAAVRSTVVTRGRSAVDTAARSSTTATTTPETLASTPTSRTLAAATTVDDETVWRDRTITKAESVVVNVSGNLTLVNTTLRFDVTDDVGIGIEVRSGGTLRLVGNSTVRAVDGFPRYYLQARANSTLLVRNSTVRDVGDFGASRELQGPYVATSDATVENASFEENDKALILDNVTGVRVVDSSFPRDSGEIYVYHSSNVRIEDGAFDVDFRGIRLHRSDSNVVVGNEFTGRDEFAVEIAPNASDNEVRDNRFEGIPGVELRGDRFGDGSHRNRVVDNRLTIENRQGIVVGFAANDTVVRGNRINASHEIGPNRDADNDALLIRGARTRVVGNDVTGADRHGIAVRGPNTTLRNNTVSGSRVHGVLLERATNATLRNNTLGNDSFHIKGTPGDENELRGVGSVSDERYYRHDVDASNTVRGGPLYYLTDARNRTVRNDGGAVWLVGATNVTVRGTGSVSAAHSEGITVEDATARGRYFGVFAVHSDRTTVRNLTATDGGYGVVVLGANGTHSSVGNVVTGGEFSANAGNDVRFEWVNDSVVRDSEASNGTGRLPFSQNAIYLSGSNLTAVRNDVTGHARENDRALLLEGRNHTVTNNTVRNNEGGGIEVDRLFEFPDWERNHTITDNVVTGNGGTSIDVGGLESVVADNVVTGGLTGIDVHGSDVEVRGNDVSGVFGDGIYVSGGDVDLRGNTVSDNEDTGIVVSDTGFTLRPTRSTTLDRNVGTNNTVGIEVAVGRGTRLTGNDVSGTEVDLHMEDTRNATLRNNTLGEHGLRIPYDGDVADFEHDIDTSNTIGGDPLYYLVGTDGATVPAEAGEVWLVDSTNVTAHGGDGATLVGTENATVRNLTVRNRTYGVDLLKTNDSTVRNATIRDGGTDDRISRSGAGVRLIASTGNEIIGVVQSNNSVSGILLRDVGDSDFSRSSDGNTLRNVTVTGNNDDAIRIESDGNTLRNVTATGNDFYGIDLQDGDRTTLDGVTVTGNRGAGANVDSDTDNVTFRNVTARRNGAGTFAETPNLWLRGSGHLVADLTTTGTYHGLRLSATNATVRNVTARNNTRGVFVTFTDDVTVADGDLSGNGVGMWIEATKNSTFTGNVITDNDFDGLFVTGESGFGDRISADLLIYDNYFDNPDARIEASQTSDSENISWNVTKRPAEGTNVVGGEFLGGNFWADYDGRDTDADGLGDTNTPYNASGELEGGDYHPLVGEERDRGKVLWETNVSVDVAARSTETLTFEVPGSAVAGSGKRKLSSRVNTSSGQVLATQDPSFYVFESNTSLTLEPDAPIYATGENVTVSGVLTNDGSAERTYDLSVRKNGTEIHAESVTLAPGGNHTYTANTTADGPFRLTASAGEVTVEEVVAVADPRVEATVSAPQRVDRGPFGVTVRLENTGGVATDLTVGLTPGNDTWDVTLAPGETRLLRANRTVGSDTIYTVDVSGDVDRSLTAGVGFAANATVTTAPAEVYAPGTVEVPYTVENVDALPTEFTATFAVGNRTRERAVYLPPDNATAGVVAFDLSTGSHTLEVDWPFGNATRTLTVAEPDQLDLNATVPGTPTNGTLRTTVELENVGPNAVNGTLRADSSVTDASRGFDLEPGENTTVSLAPAVPEGTTPGRYNLTVSVERGGETLAAETGAFETTGPAFELVSTPDLGTYGLGEAVNVTATVANTGSAGGQVSLNATSPGIAESAETAWLGAGERTRVSTTVQLPDDLEAGSYDLFYGLGEADRRTSIAVEGAKVDVEASLDEPGYTANDTATLTLNVTNERDFPLASFVRVQFNGNETVEPLSLNGSASESLSVAVPIQFGGDEKIFYGVYADTGRSLYISGAYPHRARPNVTVSTDAQIYEPGDTATVSVETDREGEVRLSAPGGFGWQQSVNGTASTQFTVPALGSGTYYLHYSFGNASYSYPFDVDGYGVQVRDARLDQGVYAPGDTVGLSLELVPTRNVSTTVAATVLDTNGTAVADARSSADLRPGRNEVTLAPALPEDADGAYLVRYRLNASVDSRAVIDTQGVNYLEVRGGEPNATNREPVPVVSVSPREPTAGEPVTFDASASRDPDGTIGRYEWDFDGDGVIDATGIRVTHTFASAGTYAVTLRTTDDRGATNTTTRTVRVAAPPATPTPTPGDGGDGGGGGGGGQPGGAPGGEVELTGASLLNDSVAAGGSVVVAVDLANYDPAEGRLALTLTADGSVVTERTVAVGASTERTVHLRHAFGTAGTYDLAVNGESAGTVRVTAATTATPTDAPTTTRTPADTVPPTPTATEAPTPTATVTSTRTASPATPPSPSTPTSGDGPGFGPVAALLALLALVGIRRLAWRDRS